MNKKILSSALAIGFLTGGFLLWSCGDEVTNIKKVYQIIDGDGFRDPEILLSELDKGLAHRFDTLAIEPPTSCPTFPLCPCNEGNDLCILQYLFELLGYQDYIDSQEINIILVSIGATTAIEASSIELAQVMGVRDWANDPEWGGLNQFYVNPKCVDPETSLVKTTMRGENSYEAFINAVTDGPISLPLEVVGQELYLVPPLYNVKLSAYIDGADLTNGIIEAVAELDNLAEGLITVCNLLNVTVTRDGERVPIDKGDAIYYLTVDAFEILELLGWPPGTPLIGLPTADRDGDGLRESYNIRLFFEASPPDFVPSYPPEWDISLTISKSTISADDVQGEGPITLTAAITADGGLPAGPSNRVVGFEVIYSPDPGALPLGTPTVAAMTDGNAIATTWIVAGGLSTKAGPVIIQAGIPDYIDKAMIVVEPGWSTTKVGLCAWDERTSAIGLTEMDVCEEVDLTVLLAYADQFANPIPSLPISGEVITFTSASVSPNPGTDTTDANGLARTTIDASGLSPDDEVGVTASWSALNVPYTLTKTGVTHLACFLGEPAFRVDKLEIPSLLVRCEDVACSNCLDDRTCNSLGGLAASITNPELQAALDEGEANVIFIYQGLTVDNLLGPTTVIGAAINGVCGVPYAPGDCVGGELEFFVEPSFYDPVTKELNIAFPTTIVAGYTEVDVGTLGFSFPTDLGPVELTLCNLIVSGTVYVDSGELSGIENGLLTGAITEDSLRELIEKGMGMPWDLAKAVLGSYDTQCNGDNAYSVRLESSAIAVNLYEVPPWY